MARPLCVRLYAGPSSATLARRILRDEPPLRRRTYGLQALRRARCGRTEDRPARARAGAWPLPRCGSGGGGPRPDPAAHARRAGPALRALEPGGGARADLAALRG